MKEHLELLNESLLQLDKAPGDKGIINNIFRSFHTMKGSTASMGYTRSAELIHRMEDFLQEMRDGRIVADSKLVQMLFNCHDFIEKFMHSVSRTGSEDGVEPGDLLDMLDECRGKCNGEKDAAVTPAQCAGMSAAPAPSVSVSSAELDYIRRKVQAGFKPYIVSIKIADDCVFKAVRAWMAFESLEQISEIVKSCPPKPEMDDFTDSSFVFGSNDIRALVISAKNSEEIYNELDSTLMEITEIKVDEYALEYAASENLAYSIIEGGASMESAVLPDEAAEKYIREIRRQVGRSELICLDSVSDFENTVPIDNIWGSFHVIKGLSDRIDHPVIYNIAAETEKFLDDCRKMKIKLDESHFELLVKSLAYIRELCDTVPLPPDQEFLKAVDSHLSMLAGREAGNMTENALLAADPEMAGLKLGEILVRKGVMDRENVNELIDKQNESYQGLKFGKVVLKEEKASLEDVVDALNMQKSAKVEQKVQSFIRVPEQKVDGLVDMLGELLIIQSLHKQEITDLLAETNRTDNKISNNILRMERITKDIQTTSMSLRMVSLKQSFQKLLRIGRDTAVELSRNVSIDISGEDTEIDRSVVEKIQDPLMHLFRQGHGGTVN